MGSNCQEGCCERGGKSFTIADVLPLIRDARQLERAADLIEARGADTEFIDLYVRGLYIEIGEKVAQAVEVDA